MRPKPPYIATTGRLTSVNAVQGKGSLLLHILLRTAFQTFRWPIYKMTLIQSFSVCGSIFLTLQILVLFSSVILFINGNNARVQIDIITRLYPKGDYKHLRR